MTVSTRKTSAGTVHRYSFMFEGQRYYSPKGGFGSKREAANAEKAHKLRLQRGEPEPDPAPAPRAAKHTHTTETVATKPGQITVAQACERYWLDQAQHLRSAPDIRRRLDICIRLLGADTNLADVRFAQMQAAINTRRGETNAARSGQLISPSGVNRDVIDAFRPARNHAAFTWELSLPAIEWKRLRLPEPEEIVTEFEPAEIERWADQLEDDAERLYLLLALVYGPRRGELFFPHDALRMKARSGPELDLGRYLTKDRVWRTSRKDGSLHTITLDQQHAQALADQSHRAKKAGCPHPWTDEAGAEISYYAMGHRLRAAAKRAGVDGERLLHGMRHHAATTIMRENDNSLALAQKLLGHKRITTTSRYAHVSKDQMRDAIRRVSRRERRQRLAPNSLPNSPTPKLGQ